MLVATCPDHRTVPERNGTDRAVQHRTAQFADVVQYYADGMILQIYRCVDTPALQVLTRDGRPFDGELRLGAVSPAEGPGVSKGFHTGRGVLEEG